jgi:hypothetical protein
VDCIYHLSLSYLVEIEGEIAVEAGVSLLALGFEMAIKRDYWIKKPQKSKESSRKVAWKKQLQQS